MSELAGHRRRRLLAALALLFMLAPLQPRAQENKGPDKVRIVYLPILGKEVTIQRFKPLTERLEKELGRPVEAISFDSYEQMVIYMATGGFEIAYLSPASYVDASSMIGLSVIAKEKDVSGAPGYQSVIICRRDSGMNTLTDAKGKTLAFTEQGSTSGFLAPMAYFIQEMGVTPAVFAGQVVFAGDHRSVILGVYSKKYDVGATDNIDLARVIKDAEIPEQELKVLWTSNLIPGGPVCVRADMPDEFKKQVRAALYAFGRDEKAMAEFGIGGYTEAKDSDYDIIRKMEALR